MRFSRYLHSARMYGRHAVHNARLVGGQIDGIIQQSASFYGNVLQPALRAAGLDTSAADKSLMKGYQTYGTIRDAAQRVDSLL